MKIRRTERTGKSGSDKEWVYGLNPVLEAIRAGRGIRSIYVSVGRRDKLQQLLGEVEGRKLPIKFAEHDFFDRSFPKGHQGVAAEVSSRGYVPLDELLEIPLLKNEVPFFVVLDLVEDPRNLGAVLRVSDAAGVHGIIIQSHRSATLSSEVSKASAGAVEYVPVAMVANVKHAIREMKERGIIIVGTDSAAKTLLWDADLAQPLALIVGSEGKGLRQTVASLCDLLVKIPMKGRVNSLNVSVATGIFSFEIFRQRSHNI